MGQVFSYIWRCIRRPNTVAKTETAQNDHLSPLELQYIITIPDGDTAQPEVEVQSEVTTEVPFIVPDFKNDSVEQEEEKQKVVVEKVIQEVTGQVLSSPDTVGRIGPYNSMQRILLVGEGDFSFSTSLALAFGSASNMIATSLNTQEYLTKNYKNFLANKRELEIRGCMLIHDVDATNMTQHSVLGKLKFDIIIYNFPHTGSFGRSKSDMRKNQNLIRGFVRSAKEMMDEDGEIHITHKSNWFFQQWDIPKIGCDQGLILIQEIDFMRSMFPGYHTKYGFGGDKNFNCNPSKTYEFGLHPKLCVTCNS